MSFKKQSGRIKHNKHSSFIQLLIAVGNAEDSDSCSESDADGDVKKDGNHAHTATAEKAQIKLVYIPGAEQMTPAIGTFRRAHLSQLLTWHPHCWLV